MRSAAAAMRDPALRPALSLNSLIGMGCQSWTPMQAPLGRGQGAHRIPTCFRSCPLLDQGQERRLFKSCSEKAAPLVITVGKAPCSDHCTTDYIIALTHADEWLEPRRALHERLQLRLLNAESGS